jgi:hypothetical protein
MGQAALLDLELPKKAAPHGTRRVRSIGNYCRRWAKIEILNPILTRFAWVAASSDRALASKLEDVVSLPIKR